MSSTRTFLRALAARNIRLPSIMLGSAVVFHIDKLDVVCQYVIIGMTVRHEASSRMKRQGELK